MYLVKLCESFSNYFLPGFSNVWVGGRWERSWAVRIHWNPSPQDSETEQDPMGLLGTKVFLCPSFLFEGNRLQSASLTFLTKVQSAANHQRNGMQKQGRSTAQECRDSPGGAVAKTLLPRLGAWAQFLGILGQGTKIPQAMRKWESEVAQSCPALRPHEL